VLGIVAEAAMVTGSHSPGTVTLMGSGELTRPMSKVHRWVISRIQGPARAVFLDTPAGFELNVDDISQRACAYVAEYVGVPCSLVSFKASDRATPRETESALRKLKRANYIFAGPGSPTYAVRNWHHAPVFDLIAKRVGEGGHLVLASAAAIAVGRYTLPVYEIYKVGEDPHWTEGLDLLGSYGLDLAIVSHWNNAEGGTFDTRYCYMGQPRFDLLESLLPESTAVLGIDEYTACILDLGANEGRVMGAGEVTIRNKGHEAKAESGTSFSLDCLRVQTVAPTDRLQRAGVPDSSGSVVAQARQKLRWQVARAEESVATAMERREDLVQMFGSLYDLAQAVDEAQEVGVGENSILEARASLHDLLIALSGWLAPSATERVGSVAPFVEMLIDLRSQARAAMNWSLADEIRDGLSALGIILEDAPSGTAWRSPGTARGLAAQASEEA
jgi:cyanophycinase-like exopeptidase